MKCVVILKTFIGNIGLWYPVKAVHITLISKIGLYYAYTVLAFWTVLSVT